MLSFKSLKFRNFMSYGNVWTKIKFDEFGTTLIIGEDLDDQTDGVSANGTGKSAIIEALVFGVYGKSISDVSKDRLVNNINDKDMEIKVEFNKENISYEIHRGRKHQILGNFVKLFKNNEEITLDSIHNTDRKIESILGISFELFSRIVVFSANHQSFFSLPIRTGANASQSSIIEELFNITELARDGEILKENIKDNENRVKLLKSQIEQLEKEHKRHDNQLQSAKKRVKTWQIGNNNEINYLEKQLEKIKGVDIETQARYHKALTELKHRIQNNESEIIKINNKILKDSKLVSKKYKELNHLENDKCPYCLQSFENASDKVEDCKNELKMIENRNDDNKKNLDKLKIDLNKFDEKYNIINDKIAIINIQELIDIKNKNTEISNKIKELKSSINPYIEPLEELESLKLEPIEYDFTNKLEKRITHQKFLHKLLTNKHSFIRKALLDRNIPFLNLRLHGYLKDLGLPHIVSFTHELSARITKFGKEFDFGNLSNGQQARVNLALSFAFRDVLQSMNDNVNICILDECLDVGLDSIGVELAAHMLKKKARDDECSMFIISHRDEIESAFDKKITVQMTNNFSIIEQ